MRTTRNILYQDSKLHISSQGEGPNVLFIQGTGVWGDAWLPQIEALSSRYRCGWFDHRGMARSQPVGTKVTVSQLMKDSRAVMDALGWSSAHIVGHSLGGLISLELALRHPEKVLSLSLLCTFSDGRDPTAMTWPRLWSGMRSSIGPRSWRRRAFLELILPPSVLTQNNTDQIGADLAGVFGHDLADRPSIVMAQFGAMRAHNVTPELAKLNGIPTLVVSAEHDIIATPAAGKKIVAGIRGASYHEIKGEAHGVPVTRPELINPLLEEHLAMRR
jgi:pimeloyl-ACP methyl ester carboxylesterase